MKPNQKSLLASLALGTALILSATSGAQAAVTITIAPSGANVVATGGGSINLTALTFFANLGSSTGLNGSIGVIRVGAMDNISVYTGMTGPATFGNTGTFVPASSRSGDVFGINRRDGQIHSPIGYSSNALLSGTATWNGATISSLGLTPGTYVYNWGSGVSADSLTVQINAVPEPSHALLSLVGLGTLVLRRRR